MSSPPAQQIAVAPASHPVFPDEILEDIFLRLDAAEDLARASAACTTFHRVVSARRFLHRFRCLHSPPVLGFFELDALATFHPADPPHRSAPAARALAQAADFTSFLGTLNWWMVCDARDGRFLLYFQVKLNLMVCDPLHRRKVRLPPIPNYLASSSARRRFEFDAFLDPATDTEKEKQDLSFRVIFAARNQHNIVTFHFSSDTGKWRGTTFNIPVSLDPFFRFGCSRMFGRYYAHGCFFWRTGVTSSSMVMLNMHDTKLSVVDLPPFTKKEQHAIVEAGEGRTGLFTITISDGMLQHYYKSLRGTEWNHERIIPLPTVMKSYWSILDAAAGYLLLQATPQESSQFEKQESQYFTLNLKTFLVERLCVSNGHIIGARLYASFLLPFSLPSI